jgi:hypothetical protein
MLALVVAPNCRAPLGPTSPQQSKRAENLCVGGPDCVPSTACQIGDTQFCGQIGDGCGRPLEYGDCVGGETCVGGVCVPEGCVPLTCDPAGGRMFLSHLHFNWLNSSSDELDATADYIGVGEDLPEPIMGYIATTFPKGAALADWLVLTGATPVRGELEIWPGQHSVAGVAAPTQDWITVPENPNEDNLPSIQYLTFNTPPTVPEEEKHGRVVLTDLHINVSVGDAGGDNSDPDDPFPTGCEENEMTPQSKALEFMFFDLSACIQPDTQTPEAAPPPEPPPGNAPPPSGVPRHPHRHRRARCLHPHRPRHRA